MKRFVQLLPVILALSISGAQAKSLYWRAIDVNAKLDASGVLHVTETQTFVFDGDWNGGERRFNIRAGQSLKLEGVDRIEGTAAIPLTSGNVAEVDHYELSSDSTLRWRSRLPIDPVFESKELSYRIRYALFGVLIRRDHQYSLAHDFVFPDRSGPIKRFTLNFTADPVWLGIESPITIDQRDLEPGTSVVVRRDLTRQGSELPASVETKRSSPLVGYTFAAILVLSLLGLFLRFLYLERKTGRFDKLTEPSEINEAWLQKNLFVMAPEMAGAACDDKIDESEVAATLATLVQERKIETTVEKRLLRKPKLVMRLIAERSSLTDWQRSVVDKLFFDDRTATDTDAIRDHYDSRGLDLAAIISEPITKRLRKLPGWSAKSSVFQWKVHGVALVVALALLIANPWRGDADGVLVNWQVLSGVLSMVLAWRATRENSRAVTGLSIAFAKVIAGMLPLFCISIYGLFQVSEFRLGVPLLLTTLVWNLAAFNLILDLLRTDDTPKKIAIRKNLASARAYFVAQLRASRPCLRDEWYPYLIAFGLGRNVDQWLRQFPKSLGDDLLTSRLSRTGIASTGSAGQQESLWTGGGGAFGGAGSAGAWAVAAGAVAGGIERSSPTNSSSSSSSGGGGGGGW